LPDGSTERDHLAAHLQASGQVPPELQVPALPAGCEVLWGVFLQLHNTRAVGMGPSPISTTDLWSYQRMHGIRLNPWELDCLQALDAVALKAASTSEPTSPAK